MGDTLEIVLGKREAMRVLVPLFRATGEPRNLYQECPTEELPTVAHSGACPSGSSQGVRVNELFEWIVGPLALKWQPYDLVFNNCQHFTKDLHDFLKGSSMYT